MFRNSWKSTKVLSNFVTSNFNMYAPLFRCPLLSSKLDSPVIKTLESGFFKFEWVPHQYFDLTGESNLDERSGQLNRGAYILDTF